jgi:hypothetical protein
VKRALLAVVLVAGALAAWPALAQAISVDPVCNGGSCTGWFTTDVALHWDIAPPPDSTTGCDDTTITTEGDTPVECDVTWPDSSSANATVHVKIDKTPPGASVSTARPPDGGKWFNHPVEVDFSGTDALSGIEGCTAPVTVSADTPATGLDVSGSCTDNAGLSTAAGTTIFYDSTPPVIAGVTPDRPPDHAGWYTHPVGLTVSGSDPLSGLAGCDSPTYRGPDGAGVTGSGSCRDVAGNVAVAQSAPFNYDATPPAAATIQVTPGNRRIDIAWTLPPDAATVVVLRSRQGAASAPKLVYSGRAASVVDKGLKNGVKYRYTVTDLDQAGNSTSRTVAAVPTASSLRPLLGSTVSAPPRLTWKRVSLASYYNVQLYRGRQKVLSKWPQTASLQVGARWHYRGRAYTLLPGHYRWYVWPGFGAKGEHRYGKLLGTSSFRVR